MTAAATPLGQLLIERGLIAAEDLDRALELQRERRGEKLGKILVDMGYVAQRDLLAALNETYCRTVGVDPVRSAMVGDSTADMQMATAAHVGRRVAVLSGIGQRSELEPISDIVIESIAVLLPGHA